MSMAIVTATESVAGEMDEAIASCAAFGIPFEWFVELDEACETWLGSRGYTFEDRSFRAQNEAGAQERLAKQVNGAALIAARRMAYQHRKESQL